MINDKIKVDPKDKRLARIIAVQAIYAHEIYPENCNKIFDMILNNHDDQDWTPLESMPSKDAINYGKKLYKMVIKIKDELDELIQTKAKNWSIDRITLLDRLILRMSLAEMIYEDDVQLRIHHRYFHNSEYEHQLRRHYIYIYIYIYILLRLWPRYFCF